VNEVLFGYFFFKKIENPAIELTTSIGVKFLLFSPPIVPLNPEMFFIKVILIVNI